MLSCSKTGCVSYQSTIDRTAMMTGSGELNQELGILY